jgi:hypothetical protein
MTGRLFPLFLVCGLVVACSGSAAGPVSDTPQSQAAQPAPPQAPAGTQRRALLVGVTEFIAPAMKGRNLAGPANDVDLFRRVLQPLGVPAGNITTLAGLPADVDRRPTRANIEREFARLAAISTKDDQVVILMAGHGSQQPANVDPKDDEPDGFDEIFLPADAAGWDGRAGHVTNAIVDDDVRRWVTAIRNKGAFVWIIFDSCQSGTMTRGGGEVSRQIPISELVPQKEIDAARQRAGSRGNTGDNLLGLDETSGEIAALFAANMLETTPEKLLPDSNGRVHGLFTYTIADILSQSTGPLTYRDLIARVTAKYHIDRIAPNPMAEGRGLDQEVLGFRTWPDRPQLVLSKAASEADWDLNAGAIHGVTRDSILEVFPPAGSANAAKPIGYVQVRSTDATTAKVFPVAFEGRPAPTATQLVSGSRGRVVMHALGDSRLRVAFQHKSTRPGAAADEFVVAPAASIPRNIDAALAALPTTSQGLGMRVAADPADWYVRQVDGQIRLVPAAGVQASATADPRDRPKQFDVDARGDLNAALGNAIGAIARARNLARLSESPAGEVQFTVEPLVSADSNSPGRPLRAGDGPAVTAVIRAEEHISFRIKNTGKVEIDVAFLYRDADYKISMFHDGDTQIKPGETRVTPRFEIGDEPVGWESAIAIATRSGNARPNFRMLQQLGLKEATPRPASGESTRGTQNALDQVLQDSVFGPSTGTRGAPKASVGSFAVRVMSWRTDPKPTGK